MNAKKLQLRIPGCEITLVVNTASSCFRVCRTEGNLDHVITGRQNNRLLSPPVLWAQWVTSYPKYSKGAKSAIYEFQHVDVSSPDGFRVGLSNVLAQPCSQMTRYGEVSTKTTCCFLDMSHLIVGQNACDTLMGNRLKIFRRKALYGSFSMRHGELADCVGCTNIFTCLLRLSSGSKYTCQLVWAV